ncbi:MAG TPA: universal stress protein [Bacteroidetes bacterium]|nr:universal stress protein [Bacteroidota bacterium]
MYERGLLVCAPRSTNLRNAMLSIQAILVPTDFSENASKALSYAKELAKGTKAKLHVVHIVEPVIYPADWSYAQVGFADIEQELQKNAETELEKLRGELSSEGFDVDTKVLRGRASDEIVAYCKEHQIGIVAMGTHGRSGLEHFLFGSTTERVLRKSPCPVLSVRLESDMK